MTLLQRPILTNSIVSVQQLKPQLVVSVLPATIAQLGLQNRSLVLEATIVQKLGYLSLVVSVSQVIIASNLIVQLNMFVRLVTIAYLEPRYQSAVVEEHSRHHSATKRQATASLAHQENSVTELASLLPQGSVR
jgi:hypothetical protein